MKNIIIFCIIFLAISINTATCQDQKAFHMLRQKNINKPKAPAYEYARTYKNEVDFLFSNLFLFYKNFISSQDASTCSFTPSCSEYAILAIKKQGLITGIINFFDRFSRCNGCNNSYYIRDKKTGLLIDPVRNLHYEKK